MNLFEPPIIRVIIPAYNEEESVALVLKDIPEMVREVIVVNNNSTDNTEKVAKENGATVLNETEQGYGAACLKAVNYVLNDKSDTDIIVFLDADYSDHPDEMNKVIAPILNNKMDLVIGSRALGQKESGSMMPQQIFGNWLATMLIKVFYRHKYTDLGPFRAVTVDALRKINMQDRNFGWTVEMQLKAAKLKMNICEIPVSYRRRIGISKVSGTVKGTFLAGYKIIWTILKYL